MQNGLSHLCLLNNLGRYNVFNFINLVLGNRKINPTNFKMPGCTWCRLILKLVSYVCSRKAMTLFLIAIVLYDLWFGSSFFSLYLLHFNPSCSSPFSFVDAFVCTYLLSVRKWAPSWKGTWKFSYYLSIMITQNIAFNIQLHKPFALRSHQRCNVSHSIVRSWKLNRKGCHFLKKFRLWFLAMDKK